MQVILDDSFVTTDVTLSSVTHGFAGFSSELKTAVLALVLPSTGSAIDDELNIRSFLGSFTVRWRPRSLISNPFISISTTWDSHDSVLAYYDMATDSVGAQNSGLKHRLNEIASKLLGSAVAPLPAIFDLVVLAKSGFLAAVEVSTRGDDAIVVIALSAADGDGSAAHDVLTLTTGSAHALAADALNSTCESSTAAATKSIDVVIVADPTSVIRPYRKALAGYIGEYFDVLESSGVSWAASVIFDGTVASPIFVTDRTVISDALRASHSAPISGTARPPSSILAVFFVGDADGVNQAYFDALAGGRPVVYGGVLCPEGMRCRDWSAGNPLATRHLLKNKHGSVGWLRPTTAFRSAVSASALDAAFAASGVSISQFAVATTVRIAMPADSTVGPCDWNNVPRSSENGFLVRARKVAFFGSCRPIAGKTVTAAFSYFVRKPACIPTTEVCDGADNNCDGRIDEGFDVDGDGYTTCAGDCDDRSNLIHPNAHELCNLIDDDCDGVFDEGCPGSTVKPYIVTSSASQNCAAGTTTYSFQVTTTTSILSSFTVPLQAAWPVVTSVPSGATRAADGSLVFPTPLGTSQTRTYIVVLGGIFRSATIQVRIDGQTPAVMEAEGPVELLHYDMTPSPPPRSLTYTAKIRDLLPVHPDVEGRITRELGLVEPALDGDGLPVLTPGKHKTVKSAATFTSWYHDPTSSTPATMLTKTVMKELAFKNLGGSPPRFLLTNADPFFPIDRDGWHRWRSDKRCHWNERNFHFTVELTIPFRYRGGDVVSVESDDDAWVFLDGNLLIDNGGVHPRVTLFKNLDTLSLVAGTDHVLRVFFAERHRVDSVFNLIVPAPAYQCELRDYCGECATSVCPPSSLSDSDGDGTIDCYDVCPNDPTRWDASIPAPCECGEGGDADGDGVVDCLDGCPNDPAKTSPGQCGCGAVETGDADHDGIADCIDPCSDNPSPTCSCDNTWPDIDGDGWPDCMDACPTVYEKHEPGVCGCFVPDVDSDGDGSMDCVDNCPTDSDKTEPGICGCGVSDTADFDGDSWIDCVDNCTTDPNKHVPGVCGCGVPDTNADGDSKYACEEECDNDPLKLLRGQCGCGIPDVDSDGDGTMDCVDGCINDDLKIAPGVCGCNKPDTDTDADGAPDCVDACPDDPNKVVSGVCGCGTPDVDTDGDGTMDCMDGCPNDPAKVQPTPCPCNVPDTDTDGDGTPDCNDGCPNDPAKLAPGTCGCGNTDVDTDGDGWLCDDECPQNPALHQPGPCGCDAAKYVDTDGDGTNNCLDGCPNDPAKTAPGVCGCGLPDVDSDNDGVLDCNDGCPLNFHKTEPGNCGCLLTEADPCSIACPPETGKPTSGQCGCNVTEYDNDNDGYCAPCNDLCDNDPAKTAPGACGCGVADTDTDGDTVADCVDGCPADPNKTAPGVCQCGIPDTDTDGDSTPDCNDGCPTDPNKVAAGVCGCGTADTDTDGDSTPDCNDGCPTDPNKVVPGVCGCGIADTDTDGDGMPDCTDQCPLDRDKTVPGVCDCGTPDVDSDGDGMADCKDGCRFDPDKTAPGVCGCLVPDVDGDGDGTMDCKDNCPMDRNKTAPGVCGCGHLDIDADSDGWMSCQEICDNNTALVGNETTICGCSTLDSDGDGVLDCADDCPLNPNKTRLPAHTCGCILPDVDTDGDGKLDWCEDTCPIDPLKVEPGVCGCGVADTDTDGDGTRDCVDLCPTDPNKNVPGVCGCGQVDILTDSDGDGWPDCIDQCPGDPDADVDHDGYNAPCNDPCDNDPALHATICGACITAQEADVDGDGRPYCNDVCPLNKFIWEPSQLPVCPGDPCVQYKKKCPGDSIVRCHTYCNNDPNTGQCTNCSALLRKRRWETEAEAAAKRVPAPTLVPSCLDDFDGDGVADCHDGCPHDAIKVHAGECNCKEEDVDSDGDGMPDCRDACPDDPLKQFPLACGCGVADVDSDNDGVPDCWDSCPTDPLKVHPSECGCNCLDANMGGDSDGDGFADCKIVGVSKKRAVVATPKAKATAAVTPTTTCNDCLDQCPGDASKAVRKMCGCGMPETDSDGDGVADCSDGCPHDARKVSPGICGCGQVDIDSDHDGTPDCNDLCPLDPLSVKPGKCGCGIEDADCQDIHRKDSSNVVGPETPTGISGAVVAIIAVTASLVVVAAAIATGGPFAIAFYRRRKAESAALIASTPVSLDGSWKPASVWRVGTVAAEEGSEINVQEVTP